MRYPVRFVRDNVIWSIHGTAWAAWRLTPVAYPWLPHGEKLALHGALRAMLRSIEAEAMLLSVAEPIRPTEVAARLASGVDAARAPAWSALADATLEAASDLACYRRALFLVTELPARGPRREAATALGAAAARVGRSFGLTAPPVYSSEVAARARQAAAMGEQLGAFVSLRPATPTELCWLVARAARRGIDEPAVDVTSAFEARVAGGVLRSPALALLGDVVFLEGGDATDDNRPRHRRYLRVETEAGVAYQTFLVLADMPASFTFPDGAEFCAAVDRLPFPVDWCARIRPVPNAEAQTRARRQARRLVGQVEEYEAELAGAPPGLAAAIEGSQAERAELAANPTEPELEVTILFALWAQGLAELEARAERLRATYEAAEFHLPRPTGGQLALFGAMLPGAPTPSVCGDYTQYLLPRDLAAGMPLAGGEVGDPTGMLVGVSLDAATARPVFVDPARGPRVDRSGAVAVFGGLGAGKSYLLKLLAWATLARGGRVVVVDRTEVGEYARLGPVLPGRSQVVHLAPGAEVCLDPLRTFGGDARERITGGFLTLLARVEPASVEAVTLAEATEAVARRDGRLVDVGRELEARGADDPTAALLARKLRAAARAPLARLAFGRGPTLAVRDADFVVFHLPGLALPDREMATHEHLARQLPPEQLASQALLYLVAAAAREAAFAEADRFAAVAIDEAWVLTHSFEGRQLLLELLRDGRKHNAAAWLASQHPGDLVDERLAALMGLRFVFRQSSASAHHALGFLGLEADDELAARIEDLGAGQCLLRDLEGRVGLVQVLEAPLAELHAALDTTPATELKSGAS